MPPADRAPRSRSGSRPGQRPRPRPGTGWRACRARRASAARRPGRAVCTSRACTREATRAPPHVRRRARRLALPGGRAPGPAPPRRRAPRALERTADGRGARGAAACGPRRAPGPAARYGDSQLPVPQSDRRSRASSVERARQRAPQPDRRSRGRPGRLHAAPRTARGVRARGARPLHRSHRVVALALLCRRGACPRPRTGGGRDLPVPGPRARCPARAGERSPHRL